MTGPKTLRQAKADYKKYGPRLSDKDLNRFERAAELDRRAEAIRAREKRRRQAQQRREEQERSNEDARRKMGIGLATQLAGYSKTQQQMKAGMETFLGLGKRFNSGRENDMGNLHNSGAMQLAEFESADECSGGPWEEDEGWNNVDVITAKEQEHNQTVFTVTTCPKKENDSCDKTTMRSPSSKALNCPSPSEAAMLPPVVPHQNKSPAKISPVKLWEDMLASSSQIAREINSSQTPSKSSSKRSKRSSFDLGLSTQVLQDAFEEDWSDDGLPNDQGIVNLQGLPLQSPTISSPRILKSPATHVPDTVRVLDSRVSMQILEEALHHEVHNASPKRESTSPFLIDGIDDSSWEAAALKILMEAET